VSSFGRSERSEGPGAHTSPLLYAKFLDFCSARVAEALLALSPDEMYVLALDAARSIRDPGAPPPDTYDEIVRLATERVAQRVELPSFEHFVAQYSEDPASIEAELIGLWRLESEGSGTGSSA
jgi:hypothetical protein